MEKKVSKKKKTMIKRKGMTGRQLQAALNNMPQPAYRFKLWRDLPPQVPKAPKGPHPGAIFSTRQMASTFNTQSGLSNVGGSGGVAQLIQNSATAVYVAIGFRLDDLGQASTFSALFDQYKIDKVHLRFTTRNPAVAVFNVASPNGGVPLGYCTADRDDATAPTSIDQVRQYDLCKGFTGTSSFDIEMEVRPTQALYAAGAFSGYNTMDVEPWIDVANTDVPHYGVKLAIGALTATVTSSWCWDIEAHYYVSFRNPR
jgi:hypothetical protein